MTSRPSLARLVDLLVHAFFREIEVTGLEHVPADRGGIIVAWHPNGMVDPALIISALPRRVIFGARDGLFRVPLLGALMRRIGTVPIRRAVDAADADPELRRAGNRVALEQLAREVAGGSFAALFPEGVSHDAPRPVGMKTGAARLYELAREFIPEGAPIPVILPVGLFYDRKHRFRSRALVEFHPPLSLPDELAQAAPLADDAAARERMQALTALIERTLHEVVHATEDWDTHNLLQRGQKILQAHQGGTVYASLKEATEAFARIRLAYHELLKSRPLELALVRRDIDRYDRDLKALRLDDNDLDYNPPLTSPAQLLLVLSQVLLVFFVLPPVLLLGFIVNLPVALVIRGVARLAANLKKDLATIKVVAGALLFPCAWIAAGFAGYVLHVEIDARYAVPDAPIVTGITVAALSALGGMIALLYVEFARASMRALRVRLTRFQRVQTLARLRRERARLARTMLAMAGPPASAAPQ